MQPSLVWTGKLPDLAPGYPGLEFIDCSGGVGGGGGGGGCNVFIFHDERDWSQWFDVTLMTVL